MIAYSSANVTSQPLARRLGSEQLLFVRGIIISIVLAIVCLPLYHHVHSLKDVMLALGLGLVGYIPVLAFMHGLRVSKVGIVAPISATSALLTVVLAFAVLHTAIHALQWGAIALVIAANVAISVNPKDIRSSNVMQLTSGIPYALIAAVGWGLFYFGLVYPTRQLGPWLSALLVETGVTIAAGLHIILTKQKLPVKDDFSWLLFGSALSIVFGTVAYTYGVYHYNVGIVAALSNSTALLSTVLAAYFFKERLTKFERVTACAMIIGVILVSIP